MKKKIEDSSKGKGEKPSRPLITKKPRTSLKLKALRQQAEKALTTTRRQIKAMSAEDIQKLVYELQVHQVELEMQNEELRRTQLALGIARDRYVNLYDFAPVGFLTLDGEGTVLEANLTACQLLGTKRPSLLGTKLDKFFSPPDQVRYRQYFQQTLTSQIQQGSENFRLMHDHTSSIIRLESLLGTDHNAQDETTVRMALIDLTAQERAEREQKQHETLFREVLETAMDAIITVDEQQRIVQFNPAAGLMFHCKVSEALGTSLDRLIPERFRHVHNKYVRTFAGSQAVNRRMGVLNQIVGLRSDGTEFPAEAAISQVEVGGKKLMTVVIRNVTERQLILRDLESVTQQTQQILNSVGEGINGIDTEGKITFINPVGAGMIGRTVDELIGQDRHETFHHSHEDGTPYPAEECAIYASLHDGIVHRVDTEVFWHKDGTCFPVEYESTPIRCQNGRITGAVVSFRDITVRKRAEILVFQQKTILEMIGTESSLSDILRQVCLMIEEQVPNTLSSILICDGLNLRLGASPNLPDSYLKVIDGIPMGPEVGSCGTAAYRKQRVVVSDIAKDPLWKDYHKPALQHGLQACWSTPILSSQQKVLGVLGLYHQTVRTPESKDVEFLDIAAHLGGIAIERAHVQEVLRGHREQLQGLSAQLLTAQEDERRRISRDLHDDVNQRLAVLALKIQTAQKELAELDPSLKVFQDLYDGVAELSDDVRHLAYQLHPSVLDDLGLKLAVQALINDFSKWEGISISFVPHNVPALLSQDVATCMYRLVQEALRNIAKHAQASEVEVGLGVLDNGLHLSVKDNGIGFDPRGKPAQKGLGLLSMKERIRLHHGTFTITSQPKKGVEISIWLPLSSEAL